MLSRVFSVFISLCAVATAAPDASPFPQQPHIKGIQVQMTEDALQLGIRHATLNLTLGSIMDLEKKPGNPRWSCEGEDYSFHSAALKRMDEQIRPLSNAGVTVYIILLSPPTKQPVKDSLLLHPDARADGKYTIAGFNSITPQGRRWLRAATEFLAHRWSGKSAETHGRVWGWIVGNELNSHWLWYNMGRKSLADAARDYESAFRIIHTAVKTASTHARCYISLDHHWTHSMHGISAEEAVPGRAFLDRFAQQVREGGDYDWHVAHHPYPEDLGNPRVWADKSVTATDETNKVTFKNLQVLCQHLQQPQLLWQGQPRRIILSEQGFHSPAVPEGEQLQAAAYAYAWEKCARLPLVDAFIYHRHVDHAREGNCKFGLWTYKPGSIADPDRKKPIYELFSAAGTDRWPAAAAFALPICGLKSWDDIIPAPRGKQR